MVGKRRVIYLETMKIGRFLNLQNHTGLSVVGKEPSE